MPAPNTNKHDPPGMKPRTFQHCVRTTQKYSSQNCFHDPQMNAQTYRLGLPMRLTDADMIHRPRKLLESMFSLFAFPAARKYKTYFVAQIDQMCEGMLRHALTNFTFQRKRLPRRVAPRYMLEWYVDARQDLRASSYSNMDVFLIAFNSSNGPIAGTGCIARKIGAPTIMSNMTTHRRNLRSHAWACPHSTQLVRREEEP